MNFHTQSSADEMAERLDIEDFREIDLDLCQYVYAKNYCQIEARNV